MLRAAVPLSGVTCPVCQHTTAMLTIDMRYDLTAADPQPSPDAYTVTITSHEPLLVAIACMGCDRSVKYREPPRLSVELAALTTPLA